MRKESKTLSLFIPVYNEEKIVKGHVLQVHAYCKKHWPNATVVVIDDSSTDTTPAVLSELAKKYPEISWVRFENGPSRRENLFKAMSESSADLVGFMDLDLAVPLSYFPLLVEKISEGYDLAIGSRRTKGAHVIRGKYRQTLSTLYHAMIKILFNSKIHDYQCGFKLFDKRTFAKLVNESGYDEKFYRGWFFDAEILLRAEKSGMRIAEIPVSWIEGENSSFSFRREIKTLLRILQLKRSIAGR